MFGPSGSLRSQLYDDDARISGGEAKLISWFCEVPIITSNASRKGREVDDKSRRWSRVQVGA